MQFEIVHRTVYNYSRAVSLGSHVIRLRPRCDGTQDVLRYALRIEPAPSVITECLDAENNVISCASFDQPTDYLAIKSSFAVRTLRTNPFDFIPEPSFCQLPADYSEALRRVLTPHLVTFEAQDATDALATFAAPLEAESANDPMAFLNLLNTAIHRNFGREIREEGAPQPPELTLSRRRGACRDLAILFIAVCRRYGLAARFVSGYQKGDTQRERRYLHAWPEVYVPGGGWRGYDPAHGLAVSDDHVPIAAAARAEDAAPVDGSFYGEAESDMNVELSISVT